MSAAPVDKWLWGGEARPSDVSWLDGAAQESNLPSVGLRRRTGFEDQLGHRAQPLRAERSEGAQGGRADLELPDSGGRYSN
jgi:hypothetical protein